MFDKVLAGRLTRPRYSAFSRINNHSCINQPIA